MELKHTHYDMLTLRSELLIVPYGIETIEHRDIREGTKGF